MDDITLRDLESGDEATLFELFTSVRSEELGMQSWEPELRSRMLRVQFDAQRRGYREQFPHAVQQLILSEGRPIGWLIVDRSGRELHGIDLALIAAARSRGIGTWIIRSLQDEAAAGQRAMVIAVQQRNVRARDLYLRLGFRPTFDTSVTTAMEWRPEPQA